MGSSTTILTFSQLKEGKQEFRGFKIYYFIHFISFHYFVCRVAPSDEYEQNISLVKNPRCRKRSSSHPAFPKVNSKVFINSFIMHYQNPETI